MPSTQANNSRAPAPRACRRAIDKRPSSFARIAAGCIFAAFSAGPLCRAGAKPCAIGAAHTAASNKRNEPAELHPPTRRRIAVSEAKLNLIPG
jgi:hypothetical protein